MRILSLVGLLLLTTTGVGSAQDRTTSVSGLTRALEAILDDPTTENGFWGVVVHDLSRDETLFSFNGRKSFVPASNTKLYTTAAALHLLGTDYRYQTRLFAAGNVENGRLDGSLVVKGAGDPSFGPRFTGDATLVFRQWADSLRAAGITEIAGDIVGDDDIFDETSLGSGWSWDDETWWYSAEISGLSYFDNTVDFTVRGTSEGSAAEVTWEPVSTSYVQVENASKTIPAGRRTREAYERPRGSNRIHVGVDVPEGQIETESITITNPTLYFVHVLREVLVSSGIVVRGTPRDVDDLPFRPSQAAMRRIAVHSSRPLSEIVRVVNKPSQNLYAEQLLHTIGAEIRHQGSARQGWHAAMPFFAETGIDTTRISLADGSGLSRMNLVTPEMTVSLLRAMWVHPVTDTRDAFLLSLPIGGVDGTLASRFTSGESHANVRAKTGTLSGVSAVSGYVTSSGGATLAFSIMSNNFTSSGGTSRSVQDRLVETLALFRR